MTSVLLILFLELRYWDSFYSFFYINIDKNKKLKIAPFRLLHPRIRIHCPRPPLVSPASSLRMRPSL